LRWNTRVPDAVEADVEGGCVTLRGTVEWRYQRNAAEHPINLVRDICNATNLTTVEPRLRPSPDLEYLVREAIERMADGHARSIAVAATNDTVHLRGSVHTLDER
jgi:osmotically-inducible protein OsmY